MKSDVKRSVRRILKRMKPAALAGAFFSAAVLAAVLPC